MARTITRFLGGAATVGVLLRHLITSDSPGFVPPGAAGEDSVPRCPECLGKATRHGRTDLYTCGSCDLYFGIAKCSACPGFAFTNSRYAWVCGKGHTTPATRKCPCNRLAEPVYEEWWRCGFERCEPFAVKPCECGLLDGFHGYACVYASGTAWVCELTGTTWPRT